MGDWFNIWKELDRGLKGIRPQGQIVLGIILVGVGALLGVVVGAIRAPVLFVGVWWVLAVFGVYSVFRGIRAIPEERQYQATASIGFYGTELVHIVDVLSDFDAIRDKISDVSGVSEMYARVASIRHQIEVITGIPSDDLVESLLDWNQEFVISLPVLEWGFWLMTLDLAQRFGDWTQDGPFIDAMRKIFAVLPESARADFLLITA